MLVKWSVKQLTDKVTANALCKNNAGIFEHAWVRVSNKRGLQVLRIGFKVCAWMQKNEIKKAWRKISTSLTASYE